MGGKEKMISRVKTAVTLLALATFITVAIWQFYMAEDSKKTDDRLVLGVENSIEEFSGAGLVGSPAPMGDLIALVSGGSFMVVNKNAENVLGESFMLSDPVICGNGDFCAAGDYGGKKARLYEKGKLLTEVETEGEIIAVTVNRSGSFAIAVKQVGYDAVITVYKKNGTPVYRYNIGNNSFIDMDLSPNNRLLLIAEANLQDGDTGSRVTVAEFNRSDSEIKFDVKSNLYLDVHFNKSGSFVCMGSTGVDIYRVDGTKTASIDYGGRNLSAADISEDDMICLGFSSEAGSVTEVYNRNGKLRGTAEFSEQTEHICTNGSYAAVSHGNTVDIIGADGKTRKELVTSSPVKYAAPFAGGKSALVFAGGNTEILKG